MDDLFSYSSAAPEPPKWPSQQLADVLTGIVAWDDVSESIKSWAAFYFWDAAKTICEIQSVEGRRGALKKIPVTIRPQVEHAIKKMWSLPADKR